MSNSKTSLRNNDINTEYSSDIDEVLYSRQLYVLGYDAMKRMMSSKILIIGLDGLGQELCKNIILAGVESVYIYDPVLVTENDYGSGFYLKQDNIGKRRDESVIENLKNINKYVKVSIAKKDPASDINHKGFELYDTKITLDNIINIVKSLNISVVISVNQLLSFNISLNSHIRSVQNSNQSYLSNSKSITFAPKFIMANSRGLFGQIFCDFNIHLCLDKNGQAPSGGLINDISESGLVTLADGTRHTLEKGDKVVIRNSNNNQINDEFSKDCGQSEINQPKGLENHQSITTMAKLTVISTPSPNSFIVDKFSSIPNVIYEFEQIKEPVEFKFQSLGDAIDKPEKVCKYNFTNEEILHELFTDMERIDTLNVDDMISNDPRDKLVREFVKSKDTLLSPICSVIGGFAAQEALKAVSGKFTPLDQFYYFHADGLFQNYDEGNNAIKDRYSDYITILGRSNFSKIQNANVFLVGAGAIGCENLKNFVMSGIGLTGKIYVTDMDSIEQSNLNRQFLFKEEDVGKMKSEAASMNCNKMNPGYLVDITTKEDIRTTSNICFFTHPVGLDSESIFTDHFYSNIDIVCNALDNVNARSYMDSRCINTLTPMIDAGTLGTRGHVQVIVPFATECYSATSDPESGSIPLCTIKSYPNCIEHVIEWATGEFERLFTQDNEDGDQSCTNNDNCRDIKDNKDTKCISIGTLYTLAVCLFNDFYYHSIMKLLDTFPPDSKSTEGLPFWNPPKRLPNAIQFDLTDSIHRLFIETVVRLYSEKYGIINDCESNTFNYEGICSKYSESELNSDTIDANNLSNIAIIEDILKQLNSSCEPLSINFDKDSWHADFIYAASNLRARVYGIKEYSKHHIIGIAGRIIPAIATTTAIVSGLSTIEIMKYMIHHASEDINSNERCSNDSDTDDKSKNNPVANPNSDNFLNMRNSFLDLAHPMLATIEPVLPKAYTYTVNKRRKIDSINVIDGFDGNFTVKYTCWSRITLKDGLLKDILKEVEVVFGDSPSMVSVNNRIIYWNMSKKYDDNLDKKISEIFDDKNKKWIFLDILTDDEQDRCAVAVEINE